MKWKAELIDAVIVDTCIFHTFDYDFKGRNNTSLPAFKKLLKEYEIQPVSNPIIINEIKKHLIEKAHSEELAVKKLLSKYKNILPIVGVKNLEVVHKRIENLDLSIEYIKILDNFFSDAFLLPYPQPEDIFERYFSTTPPFSESGKKKSEFPDAFIIQSIINYVKYSDKHILVVSNDNDWKSAFEVEYYNITFIRSLEDAIQYIQNTYHDINIVKLYSEISLEETYSILLKNLKDFTYYIDDFYSEVESIDDIMVASVENICPLYISNSKIIYSAIAPLTLEATIRVLDENNSQWYSEDNDYIITEYKSITTSFEIQVYFEAEVLINEDKSVSSKGAVKINNINKNQDFKIDLPVMEL